MPALDRVRAAYQGATGHWRGTGACGRDAQLAEHHAWIALQLAEGGDLLRALEHATMASDLERRYGEDVTWGPLVEALIRALEQADGTAATRRP